MMLERSGKGHPVFVSDGVTFLSFFFFFRLFIANVEKYSGFLHLNLAP